MRRSPLKELFEPGAMAGAIDGPARFEATALGISSDWLQI